MSDEFVTRLRLAMDKKGIKNRDDLSIAANVSPATVSNVIKDGKFRRGNTRTLIANALGVSTQWLLDGTGPMEAPQPIQLPDGPLPSVFHVIAWAKEFNETMGLGLDAMAIANLGMDLVDLQKETQAASIDSIPTEAMRAFIASAITKSTQPKKGKK